MIGEIYKSKVFALRLFLPQDMMTGRFPRLKRFDCTLEVTVWMIWLV